jgi:hypothetical protein
MDFSNQVILPQINSSSNKNLSKSLVPDFEPNNLNLNPNTDLDSFGYKTINSTDNVFYKQRGFLNPSDASEYANSIQYNLEHPFQTKYCKNS